MRLLCVLPLLLIPGGSRALSASAPIALHTALVTHGLRFELTVPAATYPRDALAPVVATMRNVSRHAIRLQKTCGYGYLWVEVLDRRHQVVYPPATPNAPPPTCSGAVGTTMLQPGQARQRALVVLLRSSYLQAVGSTVSGRVIGASTTVHLVPATQRPVVTFVGSNAYDLVSIAPPGPTHGPLYRAVFTNCYLGITNVMTTRPANRTQWLSNGGHVAGPDACTSGAYGTVSWQVVAGWIGQSAVTWSQDPG